MEENQKWTTGFKDSKKDIKTTDRNATKDFINAEAFMPNINIDTSAQHSISMDQHLTNLPDNAKKIKFDKQNSGDSSDSNAVLIDYQNITSGLESDIESNDNDNLSEDTSLSKKTNLNFDDNLPDTVTLLKTPEGCKCYLVGTAHFSIESQNDVAKVIEAVQPHIVMVELCRDRIHVLQLDEKSILEESKNLNMSKIVYIIKEHGAYKGLFYILLLNLSAHLTKVLGLAPGGEFRTALKEAKKIPNCILQLGDRPIKITFSRAFNSLSWWQTIKLSWHLLREKEPISQKDIEKYKCRDSLEQIMAELVGEYPELGEVFVQERDIFLTHSLQLACKPRIGPNGKPMPVRVVGVVGIGHTLGIIKNWGKVKREQIPPIMSIPPTSLTTKIIKYTIKASFFGAIIYVGYKLIPISASTIQSIKSSVEGLIKVSANS